MSPALKRPQLTFDELQQVRWLLGGVLTLLAVGTVFYMGVEAWTLMAVATIATVATLASPRLPAKVPGFVHTLAFPAIVACFSLDLWINGEVLPAMVRLDMMLLLYRNISYRQRRDDLQIIVLGLFLVVVAGVLTVSLLFAAHLLVYTACALAFLFVITIGEQGGRAAAGAVQPVKDREPPPWARHVEWLRLLGLLRRAADWRVVALGTALFVGVVGVSALLFMAIPRFQLENSMFLERFISKKARSGFTDTIRFGEVTDIMQDESVALSVDVSDQSVVPALPYWRMLVLDDYRDGTFRLSPAMRALTFNQAERTGQRLLGEVPPRRGRPVFWTYYLESGVSRYLPLLGAFETLQFREAQNFRWAAGINVLALRNEPVAMTAYRVEDIVSADTLRDRGFARMWAQRDQVNRPWLLFLQRTVTAADDARLQQVLDEIQARGGGSMDARAFAARAGEWLRSGHGYTLSPRIPTGDGDPLVRWLTSREAGHCELFAGSFVLLARTAGFPARVVTGFKGGTWNAYSGNFTVRNSDAHAWAEIFDEEAGGWVRADPLEPAGGTEAAQAQGVAALAGRTERGWSARLDSLRVFWYRRIVSFDQRSQAETLRAVKEATQKSGRDVREAIERLVARAKAWLTAPWDTQRAVKAVLALAAATAAGWLWREFGRSWWRRLDRARRRGARQDDPVRREAGAWLRSIAETGKRIRDAETDATVAALLRLRFGARETWPAPENVFRRARRTVRDARRRAPARQG